MPDALPYLALRNREIVCDLQVQPKLRTVVEKPSKPQSGFRRDGTLAVQNFRDPVCWHAQCERERIGGQAPRIQFILQRSTGMGCSKCEHGSYSFIRDNRQSRRHGRSRLKTETPIAIRR